MTAPPGRPTSVSFPGCNPSRAPCAPTGCLHLLHPWPPAGRGAGGSIGSGREERLIRKEYVKNIRKKKPSHRVLSDGVSLPLSQRPRTPEGCRAVRGRAAALPALVVSRPRLPAASRGPRGRGAVGGVAGRAARGGREPRSCRHCRGVAGPGGAARAGSAPSWRACGGAEGGGRSRGTGRARLAAPPAVSAARLGRPAALPAARHASRRARQALLAPPQAASPLPNALSSPRLRCAAPGRRVRLPATPEMRR